MWANYARSRVALLSLLGCIAGCIAGCSAVADDGTTGDDQEVKGTDDGNAVVFNLDSVKDIALTLDPAEMQAMTDQAHAAMGNVDLLFAKRPKATGTLRLTLQPGQAAPCDLDQDYAVSVKIKGMFSLQGFDAKPSLRIDFDKPFCGLKNLTLNDMVQDTTMVNEALAYEMYDAMGVPVPRLGYSSLTVNGQAYGVYLTLETIDKNFLARVLGNGDGPLYEGTYGGDLRDGDVGGRNLAYSGDDTDPEAQGFPQLHELVAAVNTPGDDVFYGATPLVDAAEFVSMMATAYVIGDWDNYITANNYRLYRNPKTQLWSFIPTGTDQTFSSALQPYQGAGRPPSILFSKCLSSPRCSAEYGQALDRASGKLLEPEGTIAGTAQQRADLIAAAVQADPRRPQNDDAIAASRATLASFVQARPQQIADARAQPQPPTECGVLHANQGLIPGRTLTSCDGRFTLILQPDDGNIVLYRNDGVALWATNAPGAVTLWLQDDGNVVVYSAAQQPLWWSGTNGHPDTILVVQDDGNLVAYSDGVPTWNSSTAR